MPLVLRALLCATLCACASTAAVNAGEASSDLTDASASESAPTDPPSTTELVAACELEKSQCSGDAKEGGGLQPIDRCAYALDERAVSPKATPGTPVTVADVLADANRVATVVTSVPGLKSAPAYAFRWQDDDVSSEAWIPQGITGSPDAKGSGSTVVVSFYDDREGRGVRLAFVNATGAPTYRFVLLAAADGVSPVKIHAGGLAWYGDQLYVADTAHGFRVFDTRRIVRVATDDVRFAGYKYVLPQSGAYEVASGCKPLFSWVSLDRDGTSLVSGEYCSTTACAGPLAGRVYRWPLDPATGLLRSKRTYPTEAFLTGTKQVQGGALHGGNYYFSSSAPAGGGGELVRVTRTSSTKLAWSNTPEDLMVDGDRLWGLSEVAGERFVYAARP